MAHNHHCKVCKIPVASCDHGACQGEGDYYCSLHHPDSAIRVEDKPTVKMIVGIDPNQILNITHD
jgi:hypothetical protein